MLATSAAARVSSATTANRGITATRDRLGAGFGDGNKQCSLAASLLFAWRWLARVTKPVAVAALHMPIPGSSSGAKGRGQRHGAIQTYRCDCGETCVLTMRVNSGRCGFIAVSSAQSAIRVLDSSAYIISRQSEQIWH